jgi:UPF0716 family protein affecting phage T7 exclusion
MDVPVDMLKMCLHPKVLTGLVIVGVGVFLLAPGLLAGAVPFLLLAACPLSMLVMMKAMNRSPDHGVTPCEVPGGETDAEEPAKLPTP